MSDFAQFVAAVGEHLGVGLLRLQQIETVLAEAALDLPLHGGEAVLAGAHGTLLPSRAAIGKSGVVLVSFCGYRQTLLLRSAGCRPRII